MNWHPIQGEIEILLVASCHGNRDKLRLDGPLGLYADLNTKVPGSLLYFVYYLHFKYYNNYYNTCICTFISSNRCTVV